MLIQTIQWKPLLLKTISFPQSSCKVPLFTLRKSAPPAGQPPNINHQLQAASLCSVCLLQAGGGAATPWVKWVKRAPLCRRANTRRHKGAGCLKVGQPIVKILCRGLASLCFHLSLWCVFLFSHTPSGKFSTTKKARERCLLDKVVVGVHGR